MRDMAVIKREIPSQRDVVYLAALSLSGPSEETHHHNRMMSDPGNTFGEARGCSILRLHHQYSGSFPVDEAGCGRLMRTGQESRKSR